MYGPQVYEEHIRKNDLGCLGEVQADQLLL